MITKQLSDLYRFNSRYRWTNQGLQLQNNFNYSYVYFDEINVNCAVYSTNLWNRIVSDSGYRTLNIAANNIPGDIWAALPLYNPYP